MIGPGKADRDRSHIPGTGRDPAGRGTPTAECGPSRAESASRVCCGHGPTATRTVQWPPPQSESRSKFAGVRDTVGHGCNRRHVTADSDSESGPARDSAQQLGYEYGRPATQARTVHGLDSAGSGTEAVLESRRFIRTAGRRLRAGPDAERDSDCGPTVTSPYELDLPRTRLPGPPRPSHPGSRLGPAGCDSAPGLRLGPSRS